MISQIEYEFQTEPSAYRFLNTVSHWDIQGLGVKFGRSSYHVRISYRVQRQGFDNTLSELDDLASNENGTEVS